MRRARGQRGTSSRSTRAERANSFGWSIVSSTGSAHCEPPARPWPLAEQRQTPLSPANNGWYCSPGPRNRHNNRTSPSARPSGTMAASNRGGRLGAKTHRRQLGASDGRGDAIILYSGSTDTGNGADTVLERPIHTTWPLTQSHTILSENTHLASLQSRDRATRGSPETRGARSRANFVPPSSRLRAIPSLSRVARNTPRVAARAIWRFACRDSLLALCGFGDERDDSVVCDDLTRREALADACLDQPSRRPITPMTGSPDIYAVRV